MTPQMALLKGTRTLKRWLNRRITHQAAVTVCRWKREACFPHFVVPPADEHSEMLIDSELVSELLLCCWRLKIAYCGVPQLEITLVDPTFFVGTDEEAKLHLISTALFWRFVFLS